MVETNKLSTIGSRIKRARTLAGIHTRKEFEEKYQISANTLQSWEQNKNKLTSKGALKLIAAFEKEGILCTEDWLMHGTGMPPRTFDASQPLYKKMAKDLSLSQFVIREEEAVYRETQVFKENHPNSIIINIVDDALEPYFSIGDYVGGVKQFGESIRNYLNSFCIVELENHLIVPRYLQAGSQPETYNISSTNLNTRSQLPLTQQNCKILFAAPIIWHRRKLSAL